MKSIGTYDEKDFKKLAQLLKFLYKFKTINLPTIRVAKRVDHNALAFVTYEIHL